MTEHKCYFLDAPAGRGKTFVMQKILEHLQQLRKIVLVCGTTALSVTVYPRGRTAHSAFGIPVTENPLELVSSIRFKSSRADLLRHTELIIWEELPMANKTALECTDQLLRYLNENSQPFGNCTFVGLGDFRQVAPVVRGTIRISSTLAASVKSSFLWQYFQQLSLITPIRQATDLNFATWVDSVGNGLVNTSIYDIDLSHLKHISNLEEAINFLFPNEILIDPYQLINRAFLAPYHTSVQEFNKLILDRLSTAEGKVPIFNFYLIFGFILIVLISYIL